MFAWCWFFVPAFNTAVNMSGLAESITTVGIVSCTMLFCLASGDFDLSVGSTLALSGVVLASVMHRTHSLFEGVLAALAVGAAVGLCNGFVIAQLGVNALIATLATMQIVRGLALDNAGAQGQSIGISSTALARFGSDTFLGFPYPVWVMVGCFIVFGILLHKTIFGRNTLAIGGNTEAADLAGVRVVRYKILIFMLQGVVTALAGIVVASQERAGDPRQGTGLELQVIAACVLGGVSLTGGTGTILSVIVGALFMGTVKNAMDQCDVSTFKQMIVSGSILLAAVLFDRVKNKWWS
jgi:L-arabinose transport system permease protein